MLSGKGIPCRVNRTLRLRCIVLMILGIQLSAGSAGSVPAAGNGDVEFSAEETQEYSLNDFYFDTVVSIRFDAGENGEDLVKGCRALCSEIEHTFSRTDENSELYAVNHREEDRVEVSEPLAQLVQTGLDYYKLSEGSFDITIAPLSDLWDFKSENPSVPSDAEIQSALRKVDGSAVHVGTEPPVLSENVPESAVSADTEDMTESEAPEETGAQAESELLAEPDSQMNSELLAEPDSQMNSELLEEPESSMESEFLDESGHKGDHQTIWYLTFDRPDIMIDLGALVKGYAADRLAVYLKENGVRSGLINLGGNVYAIGAKPDGSAWKIGIRMPFETGIIDTAEVQDQSVVTSGVYERCFERDGVLYHHILNPKTGYPVQNSLWSASVISDSSLTGDALSTVCMLLGQEAAEELIRQTDSVRAIFVDSDLHLTECD